MAGIRGRLRLMLVFVTCLAGCARESTVGDTSVFAYLWWVPVSVFLVGAGIFAASCRFRVLERARLGLAVASIAFSFVVAPGMLLDRVVVRRDGFSQRTGFWFAPTLHEIQFDRLSRLELTKEFVSTRHGTSTISYFICVFKGGGAKKAAIGDLMRRGASSLIIKRAEEAGVPFVDRS